MNLKKELVKNTVIIAIGKLSAQVLSFLLLPLYTSKLSTAQYGEYDFLVTLSVFLAPIITLLMEDSMFRFLIDAIDSSSRKKVVTQTVLYIGIGTTIFTIIASIIVGITKYQYGVLFILYIISIAFISLSNSLSRGLGQVKMYSLSNFILGISTILLNLFFILVLKIGIEGLLLSTIIANIATALVMFFKLKFFKYVDKNSIDKKLMIDMIRYSIPLVPNNLSWIIISMSDRLIINQFLGDSANGIYSIANKFPYILNTCYGFFSTAWKESAAKILKEKDKEEYYNSIYTDMKKFLFAIVICLISVMPFIFPIFINESFSEAYVYIPILVIAIYFSNISNFYGGIFSAYKNTKIMGTTTIMAAIINVVFNIALISTLKIYAAVISSLIANFIIYVYRRIVLKKYMNIKKSKKLGPIIMIIISIVSYYSNNWIFQLFILILSILYSILINYHFIISLKTSLLSKFQTNKIEH